MRIGVCGRAGYASFDMRGKPLVGRYGWDYLPCDRPVSGRYDVILLIKRSLDSKARYPENVRQACDRLIVDPLDWWPSPQREKPSVLWQRLYRSLKFDECFATSPACGILMRSVFPETVKVWHVPHQADPRIKPDWHDPSGPVVYAGGRVYFQTLESQFRQACEKLGRKFVADYDHHAWRSLQGAALVLSVRDGRHSTWFNKLCKPQVKLANAQAAGVPALCNGQPAELSLFPGVSTLWARRKDKTLDDGQVISNTAVLAERIDAALKGKPTGAVPVDLDNYAETVWGIVDP